MGKYWLKIKVNLDTDLSKALKLIKKVNNELINDTNWRNEILDYASILAVNSVSQMEVEITVRVKTRPKKQWNVAREFCYRLKQNFDSENIPIDVTITSKYKI